MLVKIKIKSKVAYLIAKKNLVQIFNSNIPKVVALTLFALFSVVKKSFLINFVLRSFDLTHDVYTSRNKSTLYILSLLYNGHIRNVKRNLIIKKQLPR